MPDLTTPEIGFGRRLRQERERRKISLATIAATTKIGAGLLEGLERDDVSRWPAGIFRRSFVRAYAQAIGLDPDTIVREFLERFPDPEEAPASPAEAIRNVPPEARITPPDAGSHPSEGGSRVFRLRIVEAARAFRRGIILNDSRRRWAAAAWDAGVLVAAALLLFAVLNSFWKPFGVLTLTYYVGGILVLGNTPGVCLFASERDGSAEAWPPRGFDPARLVRQLRMMLRARS